MLAPRARHLGLCALAAAAVAAAPTLAPAGSALAATAASPRTAADRAASAGSTGAVTPPTYVQTIGGPAHPGMGPSGIDVDRTADSMSGDLFVADTANSQVAAYDPTGKQLWRVGREGSKANGNFLNPRDVAYGAGHVYVADTGNNRIQVLDAATGAWQQTWSFHFQGVMGVSYGVDGSGNPIVLAADSPHSVIDVFSTTGTLLHTFGSPGAGDGQFNQARDAATDPAGNIYVADFKNERVEVLTPTGAYKAQWGTKCPTSGCTAPGQFKDPYGITLDAAGHVYVSDNIRIQEFSTTGTFIAQFGQTCPQGGCTGDELFQLRRVAVGPGSSPNVYAADLWGYKVVEYNQAGTVVQVYGNTKPATGGFDQPFGATLDGGTLAVVDTNNQRVEDFNALTGAYTGTWAHRGYGATDLDGVNWPRAITWNAATSTYWLADTKNYRLTQHTSDGTATGKVIGTTGSTLEPSILNWTYGVASYNGDAVAADTFNNRVEEWDGSSSTTPVWTATGMKAPEGVAVAGDTVYVADTNNARIVTLSATTGAQTGTFGTGQLGHPDGVAVDPQGNIWVADAGKNRIAEFSPAGTLLQTFGKLGSGNGQFFGPAALAIGPGSSAGSTWLYVVDTNNDRVQVFSIDSSGGAVGGTNSQTFTGTVDSTSSTGPSYSAVPVNVAATGSMSATLTWSSGATLRLYLKNPSGQIAAQTATGTSSLTLDSTAGTTGRWAYGVKAVNGAASYTLTVTVPAGGGGGSPLAYSASFGYNGHDKEVYPYGMAYDPANSSILVADLWNYRVLDYTENGDSPKVVSADAPRGAAGGIGAPFGLAADSSGDVWVADQSNSRVVEFSPSGKWMQTLGYGGSPSYSPGCGGGHMTIPTHLAISGGDIYVSDPRCGQVYIWTLSGTYVGQFNWSGTGVGNPIPRGLAVAGGHVYVAEFNTRKLYEFTPSGAFVPGGVSQLAPKNAMADVRGITYDPATNTIFAVGAEWDDVVQFGLDGTYLSTWGATTSRPFDAIRYITADPSGDLYVSDTFGFRVWRLDTAGNVVTGTDWTAQPPPAGSFNQNNGIAVTPGNKLYVVDSFNNAITEFDATKSCTSQSSCSGYLSTFGARGPLSSTSCNLDYPHAIAYDQNNGYLYTDATNAVLEWDTASNNACVNRWGSHGQAVGQFSNGPQGIAIAPDWTTPSQTDVYTTDVNTARLQVFTEGGSLVASMGSSGSGTNQMSGPRQLAVFGHYAYVADTGHNRVAIWDLTTKSIVGTITGSFGGTNLKQPKGVIVDPSGTWLYIADSGNDRIVRVDIAANPTAPTDPTVASTGADTPQGRFAGPEWLAFGPDGRLFVSDNSQVVYAFSVTG